MTFFTEANLARAKEIVARYPRAKSAILPLAHLAQDQSGWLSNEAMNQIADLTGVSAADVLGTCSFYTMFKRRPCGKQIFFQSASYLRPRPPTPLRPETQWA